MNKNKYLFTFTVSGRGRGVYTKLRITNEIKSYITYLIANFNANISFFSNIELGHSLSNPHLHTQIWSNDFNVVKEIYERVIKKFKLVRKRCKLSIPSGTPQPKFYDYILKDYSKNLSDDHIYNLEKTKQRIRKTLGTKLRFYSKSKGKYTKKLYRMVYKAFGVLRNIADTFLDTLVHHFTISKFDMHHILESRKLSKSFAISSFISIKNKRFIIILLMSGKRYGFEVLFYSPAASPPFC